jgi:dTMP kinase
MRHPNVQHRECRGRPIECRAGITGGTAIDTETRETGSVDLSGVAALRYVLRVRAFRRLWMVLSVASLGDWIGLLATALFASSQVSSNAAKGAAFGGTIAVRLLPSLVLGPIAGVMADRFDRRYTMVVTDLIRFVFYGSIPLVPLLGFTGSQSVAWAAIATFVGEAVTLIWVPAKEAAVPNLIPKSLIEVSNQLTLITTYGITPIVAALGLSSLTGIAQHTSLTIPHWAEPTQLALWFNGFSRLATALVVFFGIKEIGGKTEERARQAQRSMFRQFLDGWSYIGSTPQVRGLVLGIFGAFAGAGVVVGTANTFAVSLGAGPAAFYLLFGTLFIGLAMGIAAGPVIVKELSRKRWFGLSIVLASAAVLVMAVAFHLVVALIGALLVGTGAGMAFLAGTTLLYSEVGDEVRGRVFAVVNIGTRIVLLLAVAVSSTLVGLASSRRIMLGNVGVDVSSTRVLLLIAGLIGLWAGVAAFRQMDDKRGVPILADLWGSMRGRPLSPAEEFVRSGVFVVFEGGEGAGKSTQVSRLASTLRAEGRDVVVTREPGATEVGSRIRGLLLDKESAPAPRAEALLYAADRAHHVATVVRPALARGAVVISDRYVDSSLAYQGAGRTLPVQEISWLSGWATGGLKPDLVVLLDVDPGVGLGRVDSRGQGTDRLESESRAFHERVRYAFLDLAAADPKRYLVLDAGRPPAEIAEAVTGRLAGLLATAGTPHPAPAPASGPPVTAPYSDGPSAAASDVDGPPAAASASAAAPAAAFDADGSPAVALDADGSPAAFDADVAAHGQEPIGATAPGPPVAVSQPQQSEDHTPPPLEEIAEVLGIDDEAPADPPRA